MENNNEERNDVFYETPIYEEPPKKKGGAGKGIAIFLVIVIILVAVIGGVFAFSGVGARLFATKGERFVQLLTVDQKLLDIAEFDNKNVQINSEIKVDIDQMMEDVGSEPTGIGAIILENKEIVKGEDFSDVMTFSVDSMENAKVEVQIAKTGDLIGVHVPEITEGFIGVDISDPEGLMNNLEKLGMELNTENEEEITEKQQKELLEIFEKYGKVALVVLEDFIEKGSKVEIEADGKSDKATEYKLTLTGEALIKAAVAIEKEFLANEKDIDKFIELGLLEEADREDFVTSLEETLEELEKVIENESYDEYMGEGEIVIKVYEKQGKNIATIIEADGIEFGLYYFEPEKDSSSVVVKYAEDDNEMFIIIDTKAEKNVTTGELKFKVEAGAQKLELTLCETKVEKLKKIEDEMIKIEKGNILLLNTATEEDLQNFAEEASKNAEEYFTKIMTGELPDSNDENEFIDDEPVINKDEKEEENKPSSTTSNNKVASGKLAEAQKMYNKVDFGMTKSEVISALGNPDDTRISGTYGYLYYTDDDIDMISIMLEDDKVIKVEIDLYSNSYDNVCLSEDLGVTISDLNKLVGKLEKGMTLNEVEKVLGDKYFESEKWDGGETIYTWYDTAENRMKIEFKDGKVEIIYNIYKSY